MLIGENMELTLLNLVFNNINLKKRDISKVRGFIASKYSEFDELHNHTGNKFIYRYPLIQYKIIEEKPAIIGINEGIDVLLAIEKTLDILNISNQEITIFEKGYLYRKYEFGISEEMRHYHFTSPWMCLNQDNYNRYCESSDDEKTEILKKILIANILSMSKRFNYTVNKQINVLINLKPCNVKYKNQNMLCFLGDFLINFYIPDNMGIGRSVSRGFGTITSVLYK